MPAATSLEDIYHHSSSALSSCSCSLSSSYSPSSKYHLPDYMQLLMAVGNNQNNQNNNKQQKHYHRQNNNNLNNSSSCSNHNHNNNSNNSSSNRRQLQKSFTYQPSQHRNTYYTNQSQLDQGYLTNNYTNYHQHQRQVAQTFKQQSYLNEDYLMGRNGRRVPIGEPVLFLYHDDDLSSSSAPDSFHSMTTSTTSSSHGQQQQQSGTTQGHHLTIEELRLALNSCWLCGCNWQQDHVSLDCQECGGYALTRPCPNCDGQCKEIWKRNITGSHDHHKARWVGQCLIDQQQADCCSVASGNNANTTAAGSTSQSIAAEASLFRNLELRSDDDDDDDYRNYEDDDYEEDEDDDDDDDCGIQVIPVTTQTTTIRTTLNNANVPPSSASLAPTCDHLDESSTFDGKSVSNDSVAVVVGGGEDCDSGNNKSHDEQQNMRNDLCFSKQ